MRNLLIALAFGVSVAGCQQSATTGPGTTTHKVSKTETSREGEHRTKTEKTETTEIKKLTLTAPTSQTIKRGDTDKVTVMVNRTNFDDPVEISFSGLPKGVEVVDKDAKVASGNKSITVTLKASADAAVGEHEVTLIAKAPGSEENRQTFKLTVKEK